MKRNLLYIALLSIIMTVSCEKAIPEGFRVENPQQYSKIYVGSAFHGNMNLTLVPQKDTVINVYANYGGLIELESPISVTFEAMPELVDEYNALMQTSYKTLPMLNYVLEHRTVTIKAGEFSSEAMRLRISSESLPGKGPYMLAISITQVNGGEYPINSDLKTMYIIVNYDDSSAAFENYEKAGWVVLDASSFEEGSAPESILDGDRYTNWTCSDQTGPHYVTIDMRRPLMIHGLDFTSHIRLINGMDYHYAGQPRNVKISVSSDNEKWTEVVGDGFVPFGIESSLKLDNYVKARYVKLEVSNTWITKQSVGTNLSFSEFNVF